MKKIFLAAAIIAMAFSSQAQEIPERKTGRPPMMERKRHDHGMEFQKLNLSEDQKAKFKVQNESFHKKMEELKKNDNITVKEWRSKAEALRKDRKSNMQNILTGDQKAQLEKMKAEGIARQEAMAKSRGEKMKSVLGLSDEQSAKMQANREKVGEKMKAIRENTSLTEEQKKENMKTLHKEQKEFMKSILTDEQLKKMKENMHKRPEGEKKGPEIKQTI